MTTPYNFAEPDMSSAFRTAIAVIKEKIYPDIPIHMLEIGVYDGRSGCYALDTLLKDYRSCYCGVDLIEGHEEAHERAKLNFARHGDKVTLVPGDSKLILPLMLRLGQRHFDIIHVDGCHSKEGCRADLENSWKVLSLFGFLIVDDYRHPDYGLEEVVDSFLRERLREVPDSVGIIYSDYNIIVQKKG